MATTRTVKRTTRKPSAPASSIAERLRQFLNLKAQIEFSEEHLGELKGDLSGVIEEQGYADDKGHYWFDLDEPVEANVYNDDKKTIETAKFGKIKREKRVTTRIDPDAAEEILKKKKLLRECTTTLTVLDEEAINKAYFQGKLTKADIDKIFKSTITWAFKPVKG